MRSVVDLFAGCGGMSLGMERAGFTPVFVSELHPDARATYTVNRQGLPVAKPKNQAADIIEVTKHPAELDALAGRLRREHGDVNLVVGGPPCQGFSGIGHRRTFDLDRQDIPSNHLYKEMATFISAVAPRAFVFENVRGLLSARWTKNSPRGEIWAEVQETFESIRTPLGAYKVKPDLLFAARYGVPQNRPRVILIGVREDVETSSEAWHPKSQANAPDLVDLLGDLVDENYPDVTETTAYPRDPMTELQVEMRQDRDGNLSIKGEPVTEHQYARHSARVRERFTAILQTGVVPEELRTRKFYQRPLPDRWDPDRGPSITVASLPDDYVHFAQPRACTVREWARLQTFPDWYQFVGKRTTGGRNRAGDPDAGSWARDLPKFTQIGNAVPVKMAEAIGRHLRDIGI